MTHVMATGNQHLNVQAEGGSSGVEIQASGLLFHLPLGLECLCHIYSY